MPRKPQASKAPEVTEAQAVEALVNAFSQAEPTPEETLEALLAETEAPVENPDNLRTWATESGGVVVSYH